MDRLTIAIEYASDVYVIRLSYSAPVYVLAVATADGDIVWKVTPLAFQKNEVAGSVVFSAEVSGVPDAVHDYLQSRRQAFGGDVPAVQSVTYGVVPQGYKEVTAVRPLKPATRYHVIVMGPQGDATAVFTTDSAPGSSIRASSCP